MNLSKFISMSVIGILSIFSGCKKGHITRQEGNINNITLSGDALSAIEKVEYGGVEMLKFNSWNEFDSIANELSVLQDAYEANFYNEHYSDGMTDDDYNLLIDDLEFSDDQPLIEFENAIAFDNSYRKILNIEMDSWLSNRESEMDSYPKNKTLFSGSELSLINDRQQVMIGDTIYQSIQEGYFAIGEDYDEAVNEINDAMLMSVGLEIPWWPQLKWWFVNPPAECVLWKKNGIDHEFGGKYKVTRSCGIRSFTAYCKTLAELDSYEWRNNKWRNYKRNLGVSLNVSTTDNNCSPATSGADGDSKNKSSFQVNITIWGTTNNSSSHRAQLGSSIFGSFTYAGLNPTYYLQ